jgi:TPR repeat protein
MAETPPSDLVAAAERGDAEAQNELGKFYLALYSAEGADSAKVWFRRAADQGLPNAMHNLGVLDYNEGRDGSAQRWFAAAIERGWLNSAVALGVILEEAGRGDEAMKLYEAAAEKGNANGQDVLADKALDLNTEEGYIRARHLSELAAAQGSMNAECRLGSIYHEGLAVERDPKRAFSHWMRAALSGHPGSQFMIAVAYEVGAAVEADRIESAFWYTRVAPVNEQARYMLERLELSLDEKAALELRLRQATSH